MSSSTVTILCFFFFFNFAAQLANHLGVDDEEIVF